MIELNRTYLKEVWDECFQKLHAELLKKGAAVFDGCNLTEDESEELHLLVGAALIRHALYTKDKKALHDRLMSFIRDDVEIRVVDDLREALKTIQDE